MGTVDDAVEIVRRADTLLIREAASELTIDQELSAGDGAKGVATVEPSSRNRRQVW
jgi:hypothetical protein